MKTKNYQQKIFQYQLFIALHQAAKGIFDPISFSNCAKWKFILSCLRMDDGFLWQAFTLGHSAESVCNRFRGAGRKIKRHAMFKHKNWKKIFEKPCRLFLLKKTKNKRIQLMQI